MHHQSGMSLFYPQKRAGTAFTLRNDTGIVSGRASDSRIHLLFAPSRPSFGQWHVADFVPDHSSGPVSDLHGVPYQAPTST